MLTGFPFRFTLEAMNPHSNIYRALVTNPGAAVYQDEQRMYARNLEVPSGGGVGTARGIAHAYGVFAAGGRELGLRQETLDLLAAPATPPTRGFYDECMKADGMQFSLGFMKSTPTWPFGSARSFGSPGSGGSLGFADPEAGVGYAYVTSQMGTALTGDPRDVALREALYSALQSRTRSNIMTTIRALITRYPVPTYFALTFALSWGGVLIVVGPDGIPGTSEQLETLFPFAFLAMLVGPSVAGVLLTGVVYRKPGFRDVFSRLLEWRVAPQWYAVALLTAPLLMTATLFALSLTSPVFLPGVVIASDKATVLLAGLAVGLGAGIFEELGWTGFAIPTLRRRTRCPDDGPHRGCLVGGVALADQCLLGKRPFGRRSLAVPLLGRECRQSSGWRIAGLQGADGMGLRPGRESLLVAMLMHVSLTARR